MSLRPRYSLLSLLVLTALVAGGVKWWYGPHRTVERAAVIEVEYTYTRDWRGHEIKKGPCIARFFDGDKYFVCHVEYFRQGEKLPWLFRAELQPLAAPPQTDYPDKLLPLTDSPLEPHEQTEFLEAVERERQRLVPAIGSSKRLEYQGPEHDVH